MKNFLQALTSSILVLIVFGIFFSGIYPLVTWGVAQVIAKSKAQGSLLHHEDKVLGSRLIGQNFEGAAFFHPRPSAANYDAIKSTGSNLGPTSRKLYHDLQQRAQEYRNNNFLPVHAIVPVDAVTTSGSGLDSAISVQNALIQAKRVAQARGIPVSQIKKLIEQHTEKRTFGVFGEPRINVLELNYALSQGNTT